MKRNIYPLEQEVKNRPTKHRKRNGSIKAGGEYMYNNWNEILEQMKRNCDIMESDILNNYYVDTLEFIAVLRQQVSLLEKELKVQHSISAEIKEQKINRRNTKYTDKKTIINIYRLNDYSVKKTLEDLHAKGISISDKQLRNILIECGVYQIKRKRV